VTEDVPVDEELAPPPGVPRRLRQALVGAAVCLLVVSGGVLVRRALAPHPIDGKPAAAAPLAPPRRVIPELPVIQDVRLRPAPTCPRATDGQVSCTTVRTVPRPFLRAVRSLVPRVVTTHAVTNMLRPTGPDNRHGLWSRSFTGRSGSVRIWIVVTLGGPDREPATAESMGGPRAIGYARMLYGRYTVQVQIDAPTSRMPTLDAIGNLASDPRMVRRS
jgi:hypothetical protein